VRPGGERGASCFASCVFSTLTPLLFNPGSVDMGRPHRKRARKALSAPEASADGSAQPVLTPELEAELAAQGGGGDLVVVPGGQRAEEGGVKRKLDARGRPMMDEVRRREVVRTDPMGCGLSDG
jgi:hypothetical protein